MSLTYAAITGNYEAAGNLNQATHVIAHAFGYRQGPNGEHLPGVANESLGAFLGSIAAVRPHILELPWFLQKEVSDALPQRALEARGGKVDKIISTPSNPDEVYLDSWDVFIQSQAITDEFAGYGRPLVIAQAHHVGRVAAQARRIGYEPVVPAGLPAVFDPQSAQWWTRSRLLWAAREVPGMHILRRRGKL